MPKVAASMFQFTLPRGERLSLAVCVAMTPCFNSRSRVGSDKRFTLKVLRRMTFQFTLPRGERQMASRRT